MTDRSYTAEDIRKLRDLAEVSIQDVKRAFELLHDPTIGAAFGGDILHALGTVEAGKLAINIRPPSAREAWNIDMGAKKAETLRSHVPALAEAYPKPAGGTPGP